MGVLKPRRLRAAGAAALAAALCAGQALAAGQPGSAHLADRTAEAVAEASRMFGLPPGWIEAVIAAESGGEPRAVSRAGAMGLMQLTPGTWSMLRARLGLGPDPFEVRDNVLAGAAYMRELYDRFGAPGFLAAYNAGPERYAAHLQGRARLPAETRAYMARLAPRLSADDAAPGAPRAWAAAPLFPARGLGGLSR